MKFLNFPKLKCMFLRQGAIAIFWDIDDVKYLRSDLEDDQCIQVLKTAEARHNAESGINWNVLSDIAAELFPEDDQSQTIGDRS